MTQSLFAPVGLGLVAGQDAVSTVVLADSSAAEATAWWIGGVIVLVLFGGIVIRTLRRNRLRK